jgi:hypothetical protein
VHNRVAPMIIRNRKRASILNSLYLIYNIYTSVYMCVCEKERERARDMYINETERIYIYIYIYNNEYSLCRNKLKLQE